jgi:hypothetical protein
MKTCVECQSPVPQPVLACPACGCGIFSESGSPEAQQRPPSRFALVLKWAVGYILATFLLGMVTTILAHILLRSGLRPAAEGIATSPILLNPLLTVLFFAFFSSRHRSSFVQAGALYVTVSVLAFGLHLLGSGAALDYAAAAAVTLFFALVGTTVGFFFRPKAEGA